MPRENAKGCFKVEKNGGLAERSIASVLKTDVPVRVPGVRIPEPPPTIVIGQSVKGYLFIITNDTKADDN